MIIPKLLVTAGATTVCAATVCAATPRHERPNILFCIADDASYHHFGATGCSWVSTPSFDRVASQGVLFHNCYTPNAKSAPSRAVILTGRNSWQLEEAGNHIPRFPSDYKVVTEVLSQHGYDVAYTGKSWAPGDPGMVDGKPRQLTGRPYQKRKTEAPTKAMSKNDYAANFADFLDDNAHESKPWFFWFGATEPHRRYEYGSGVALGGKSTGMIDRVPSFWPDTKTVRNDMLDYGFEIEYFDSHIGRMIAELEHRGELENTIVIITSDNGMPFPRSKGNNYEYSHHMPLAIMWHRGIDTPGREVTDMVSFTDFTPLILDVAGIDGKESGMKSVTGKSLLPILRSDRSGRTTSGRTTHVFGRERHDYGRPQNQGYPIRGIIRDNWMLIWNIKPHLYPGGNPETGYLDIDGSPTKSLILKMYRSKEDDHYYNLAMGLRPSIELYDLSSDRDCVVNLAQEPSQADRITSMCRELLKILRKQGDPRITGDGGIFDRYPFDTENKTNFYERVVNGEIAEPWKQTRWVDRDNYPAAGDRDSK